MDELESRRKERVLLVEGQDDKHVVGHLCSRIQAMPPFYIIDKGGIEKLLASIGPEIKAPGRKVVGILSDANENPRARWDALRHRLAIQHFELPANPDPNGTVIDGSPRIGIWLWPDNQKSGELENFVKTMIPRSDRVWPLAQEYVNGIPEQERRFPAGKTLKAQLHAWLATRQTPGRMGSSIGRGELEVDGLLTRNFVEWLRRLFELRMPTRRRMSI